MCANLSVHAAKEGGIIARGEAESKKKASGYRLQAPRAGAGSDFHSLKPVA